MATDVSWMLELNVQPGREKDFRVLMQEMVTATRANEPGTLNYEWSTDADGSVCHILERYIDSQERSTLCSTGRAWRILA